MSNITFKLARKKFSVYFAKMRKFTFYKGKNSNLNSKLILILIGAK